MFFNFIGDTVPLGFARIPIAYYASFLRYHMPGTTDFNYFHYWGR